jgi:hypothetical protein
MARATSVCANNLGFVSDADGTYADLTNFHAGTMISPD